MKQFNCLDPAQSIEGKIFIEASAGTGKTFAIEHIVRRLILKGVPLKRILITTFTKKGVRDLKRRIYENLRAALAQCPSGSEEMLTLENNLAMIEEAEIHTIHSFCNRCLNEFAFEAGLSLNHDDPESEEKQNEVKSAIFDTLRTTLDDQEFSPSQLLRLMSHFMRDVQKLVKKIANFLAQDLEIDHYLPYTEMKRAFDQIISSIDTEYLKSDLTKLIEIHKKCQDRSGTTFAFIEKQIENIDNLEVLIATSPSIFSLLTDSNLKKGKSRKDASLRYENEIDQLGHLVNQASDPLITFMRLAEKAKERVDLIAMKNPNYLLDAMASRLDNKRFCNLIKSRYSSVIIDEFQDTDPKQWAIFNQLFFQSANPFVVVGDPKQSIYGFRGADLATYLKAKESFSEIFVLSTNYRSSRMLIEALNRLFANKQVKETFSLPYEPITAGKDVDDRIGVLPIITEKGEERIMRFVADEICRLKTEENRPLSHSAVLVKDRFQAARMTKILEEQKISVLSTATESITSSEAFRFVELVLKLKANVRNTSTFNQFLLHPFVGWPIEMIGADLNNPELSAAITKFSNLQTQYAYFDDAAFLRALLNETFFQRPIEEAIQRNPQHRCDLMQTIELIFGADRNNPLDAIASLHKRSDLEVPALKRRPLSDQDAVHVMTMHMSKGLEFEIVFPIGIIAPSKAKQEFTKTKKMQITRFSAKDQEAKDHLNALDQEKMRLFYVALTRAKSRLILPFCIDSSTKKVGSASSADLFLAALLSDKKLSQQEVYDQIPTLTKQSVTKALAQLELDVQDIDDMELNHTLELEEKAPDYAPICNVTLNEKVTKTTSFSALATPVHSSSPIVAEENTLPYGAHTGNIFHLLFEKIIENGLYFPWNESDIYELIEDDLSYTHLSEWKRETYDLIHCAFHTNLDNFTLADIPPENMLQETPFLFQIDDHLDLKGFADLIFLHEKRFYILDWKMNYLSEYSPQSLDKAMNDHDYKKQAAIYTEALQLYTQYFPDPMPLGGSFYFFLRGKENGLYFHQPEKLNLQLLTGAKND